jgi:hypothetical protein
MAQEATKTEYAIAILGLAYITAFTAAEQLAGLGAYAYRQVAHVFGEPADADPRATRSKPKPRPKRQATGS